MTFNKNQTDALLHLLERIVSHMLENMECGRANDALKEFRLSLSESPKAEKQGETKKVEGELPAHLRESGSNDMRTRRARNAANDIIEGIQHSRHWMFYPHVNFGDAMSFIQGVIEKVISEALPNDEVEALREEVDELKEKLSVTHALLEHATFKTDTAKAELAQVKEGLKSEELETPLRRRSSLPICYVFLLPSIMEAARRCGYCIAIHGSLLRDFDLIAVPWNADSVNAETLVREVTQACGGLEFEKKEAEAHKNPTVKPHGRLAWNIILGGSYYLDLSVMPLVQADKHPTPAQAVKEWSGESRTLPVVLAFARRMEAKLAKNRHKGDRGGWLKDTPSALLRRLKVETNELEKAIQSNSCGDIANEAADVANFAMMIADVCGGVQADDSCAGAVKADQIFNPKSAQEAGKSPKESVSSTPKTATSTNKESLGVEPKGSGEKM